MDNKSVKNNIYKLRKEKKLSQKEAAEKMGLSRNSYRSIEKGDTVLVSDRLVDVAKAFDTSLQVVLGYGADSRSLSVEDNPEELYSQNVNLKKENEMLRGEISRLEGELEKAQKENTILTDLSNSLKENLEDKKNAIEMLKKKLAETEESE